jgi:hypothetical protein
MRPSISTLTGAFGVVPVVLATCDEVQALPLRALRVYLVLLSRFNAKRDGWSWSKAAFARDTGVHRDHIGEVIKRLEASGLLSVERGHGLVSSHYRLTVPPSLTVGEGASLAPRVGADLAPSPLPATSELAPRVGASLAPRVGASLAPTLHRDHTEVTTEPPYPHSEQNRAEPKNPLAPCKQGEPIRSSDSEGGKFALPERYNKVKRPPGPWQHKQAPASALEVAVARTETASPADLIRQVARDLGVRPREARKHLARQDASAVERERTERHGAPSVLTVDDEILREMHELYGWPRGDA